MSTNIKIWGTAGTGKTTELLKQIRLLSEQIPSNQIVTTTFRRNAADDLACKLSKSGIMDTGKNWVSTIHGIAYRINGLKKEQVMQNRDFKEFCKKVNLGTSGVDLDYTKESTSIAGKAGEFFMMHTWLKNTMTPLERCSRYPNLLQSGLDKSIYIHLANEYTDFKLESNKVDFCDMLDMVIDGGLTPPGCKALIVDEFQDLTTQQHAAFNIWADDVEHVTVAGDPLQSIYSFWGGTTEHFNNFDGELGVLGTTYRLPMPVWDMAQMIVKPHQMDVPGIKSVKPEGIIKRIDFAYAGKLLNEYSYDTMHLVRANYQAIPISYQLADGGIIFVGINGWSGDDISLLNAIIKTRAREPISRPECVAIVNALHQTVFTTKKAVLKKIIEDSDKQYYTLADIQQHTHNSRLFGAYTFTDVIDSPIPTSKMNLTKLKAQKISGALKHHHEPVSIGEHTVKLHTIHGSKGLESETVFLHTGITAKIQKNKFNKIAAAEEARVFFVGATRTKQNLYIVNDPQANYVLPRVAA